MNSLLFPSRLFFVAALLMAAEIVASAQVPGLGQEPARADVLKLMRSVADYHLAHPDYIPRPNAIVKPTAWEFGVCWNGIMALAPLAGDDTYYKAGEAMGEKLEWKLGPRLYVSDDMTIGQTYAELYLHDPQPEKIAPLQAACDAIMAAPPDDDLSMKSLQPSHKYSYIDTLFVAPPAWALLSQATKDPKYVNYASTRFLKSFDFLLDKEEHLVYRDDRFFSMRDAQGGKIFWARGNGWAVGALARMLQFMPPGHPDRPRYVAYLREVTERLKALQQPDGSWHSSLLNPGEVPAPEESGTALFTYAMAWGIHHGVLDRASYEPCVLKAWAFLVTCVDPDGKLNHVQGGGDRPHRFPGTFTTPFGVGAFLLAGSEVIALGEVSASR